MLLLLLRDIGLHTARASEVAKHGVAPQWPTSPPLNASIFSSPLLPSRKPAPFGISDRRLQMLAFLFSFIHVAEKQEGSVSPQQSASSICHCNVGLLHENIFLLVCPSSISLCPITSIASSVAAVLYLFIFSSFLSSVSLGWRSWATLSKCSCIVWCLLKKKKQFCDGWMVTFKQDLAGNWLKSLIYCWILKTCRARMKVCVTGEQSRLVQGQAKSLGHGCSLD